MWSFAKPMVLCEELFNAVASRVIPEVQSLDRCALAMFAWNYAYINHDVPEVYQASAKEALRPARLEELTPRDLANLMRAFAKAGVREVELMQALSEHGCGLLRDGIDQKCYRRPMKSLAREIYEEDFSAVDGMVDAFDMVSLAEMLSSFADQQYVHHDFLSLADEYMMEGLRQPKRDVETFLRFPQVFARALVSRARAYVDVSGRELFQQAMPHVVRSLKELKAPDVLSLVVAWAMLGPRDPDILAAFESRLWELDGRWPIDEAVRGVGLRCSRRRFDGVVRGVAVGRRTFSHTAMARPASLLVLLLSAHLTFVALRRRPAQLRSWRKATEDPWREAYDAELRRNELLLEKLSDCNRQIEEVLRLQSRNADESAQAHISGWSWSMGGLGGVWILWMKPAMGMKNAAFFTFQGRLPLGLQLRKQNEGRLKGAFLVEDIFPGPAAEHVWRGDILHALTVVMDRANLGIKTEDFVSSVVGGLGRWRQTIVDASFINTVEDMVDQLNSNTMLGSDTEILLIFERDISSSPEPDEILEPAPK
ncbi:unnamed protein product [Durusdinium trenchii]|uniref:Uncharacterized protein n=1 Tax=Durusdinium trenchii TaxID=1381693 RepID=A0ABP0QGU1_9DINO